MEKTVLNNNSDEKAKSEFVISDTSQIFVTYTYIHVHTGTYRRSNGRLKRLLTGRPGGGVINNESAHKEHFFVMYNVCVYFLNMWMISFYSYLLMVIKILRL